MSAWVILFKSANPLQELLCPSLLKQTHQRRAQRFARSRRNFGDGRSWTRPLLHEATGDLSELQIPRDICRDQNVGELAVGHQQFRYEIDVPVVDPSILFPGLFPLFEVAIFPEQLFDVRDVCQTDPIDVQPRYSRKRLHCHVRQSSSTPAGEGLAPAIVVVAVDVQDFLALYTQNTMKTSAELSQGVCEV